MTSPILITPFSYDSNEAPPGYVCTKCGAGNTKLWRDYNTFLDHLTLYCLGCAVRPLKLGDYVSAQSPMAGEEDPSYTEQREALSKLRLFDARRDEDPQTIELDGVSLIPINVVVALKLAESDQLNGYVPAVPLEDGSTFWGYSSVPIDGVEWWYRLPCPLAVRPSRTPLTAAEAKAKAEEYVAEQRAQRDQWETSMDHSCAEARFLVSATSCEQHMLWERWHYRPHDKMPPTPWEKLEMGCSREQQLLGTVPAVSERSKHSWEQVQSGFYATIATLDGRPICVSVSFVRVDGALVAFYDVTSQLVDRKLVEEWLDKRFPNARSHTNAMNFHNTAHEIRRQREEREAREARAREIEREIAAQERAALETKQLTEGRIESAKRYLENGGGEPNENPFGRDCPAGDGLSPTLGADSIDDPSDDPHGNADDINDIIRGPKVDDSIEE